MFRRVLVLAVVFSFCVCTVHAEQISSQWVGGERGTWGDSSNWDPAVVPDNDGDTFAVTIDSGTGSAEVEFWFGYTIDSLTCYGDTQLDRPMAAGLGMLTLVDPNGLMNYDSLDIGRLNISGNINNIAGASCYLHHDMEIRGNIYNQANAKLELEGDVQLEGDYNLENAGTMWMWGGEMYTDGTLNNTGQINLVAAGCGANRILNASSGVIRGWGDIGTEDEGELLQNEGLISASGGVLLIGTANNAISNNGFLRSEPGCFLHVKVLFLGPSQADVNNTGKIEVKSGGGVTFYCNLLNQANGEIELLGGTLAATTITQTDDVNFAGFGTLSGDIQIDPNGMIELTGPTNVFGDVEIGGGATLEVKDGTTIITGHTTCNNGTIHMIGGRVICQGGLTNNGCEIIWEPGIDSNAADYNLDGRVNLEDYAQFARTWLWEASWR